MTHSKALLSAACAARSALRALECRQLAAAAAQLTSSNTASLWTASESAQQPGRSILEARQHAHTQASTSSRTFFSLSSTMPAKVFNQRRLVGWTPEQLYTVVSRVEDYHKFVPWCQRSTIVKPLVNNYMEAELEVGFQVLVERYTSKVFLTPPRSVRSTVGDSSLFHHLDSTWTMEPGPTPRSCWLSFSVDFAFRSPLHGYLADLFFSEVVKQMSGAFEGRCAKLYGPSSLLGAPAAAAAAAAATGGRKTQVSVAAAVGARVHAGQAVGKAHGQGVGRIHKPAPAAGPPPAVGDTAAAAAAAAAAGTEAVPRGTAPVGRAAGGDKAAGPGTER